MRGVVVFGLVVGLLSACGGGGRGRGGGGGGLDSGTDSGPRDGTVRDSSSDSQAPAVDTGVRDTGPGADARPPLACAPVAQDDCPSGEACYFDPTIMNVRCAPEGSTLEGDACSAANECVPGTVCAAPTGGAQACHRFCDSADDCDPGARCVPTTGTSIVVGLCV